MYGHQNMPFRFLSLRSCHFLVGVVIALLLPSTTFSTHAQFFPLKDFKSFLIPTNKTIHNRSPLVHGQKKARALLSQRKLVARNCKLGGGKTTLKEFGKNWGHWGSHYYKDPNTKYLKWSQKAYKDHGYLDYTLTKSAKSTYDITINQQEGYGANRFWVRRSPKMYLYQQAKISFNVQSDDYHAFRLVPEDGDPLWMGVSNRVTHLSNYWTSKRGCCSQKNMDLTVPTDGWYVIVAHCYETGGGDNLFIPNDVKNNKNWDDQGFCRGCLPGYYSDTTGSERCKTCPVSKYTDQDFQSSCKSCSQGKYTAAGSVTSDPASCLVCERATYGDGPGEGCKECPAGKHGRDNKHTGGGLSDRCLFCPEGYYQDELQQLACKACKKGFYTSATGGDSPASCLACARGRYNDVDALVNTVANGGSFACKTCPIGFYQPFGSGGGEEYAPYFKTASNDGIGDNCLDFPIDASPLIVSDLAACQTKCAEDILCQGISYDSNAMTCVRRKIACSGKSSGIVTTTFYGRHLSWNCISCPAAKYADATLSWNCTSCPSGHWLDSIEASSISACKACEAGKYGDQVYTSYTGCKICSSGRYTTGNPPVSSCAGECAAGRFAEQSTSASGHDDVTDCLECPIGYFQPGSEQSRCLGCSGSPAGATSCAGCAPGRKKVGEDCVNCEAGKYTDSVNMASCTACLAGYYAESTVSATRCVPCPQGKYSVHPLQTASSSCTVCEHGRYSNSVAANDAAKCTACDAGRYNSETGSPDPSQCQPCTPGKWNNIVASTDVNACKSCGVGKYSTHVASSSESQCDQCPIGWYQEQIAQTSCQMCPPGKSQPGTGESVCISCARGSYSPEPGLSSCTSCNPGKMAPNVAMPVCFDCVPGKYVQHAGYWKCESCVPGKFQNVAAQTGCLDCSAGQITSMAASSSCIACQMGKFQAVAGQAVCDDCEASSFSDSLGSIACKDCVAGRYSSRSGTVECPACLPGQYSSDDGATACDQCPEGQYESSGSGTACIDCTYGKWGPMGSVQCMDCLPGRYANVTGLSDCEDCPRGYYALGVAQSFCRKCVAGTYSLDMSSTCSVCAKGSFNSFYNASECHSCGVGKFQETVGSIECKLCPIGFATNSTESIKCSPCVEGRYAAGDANFACKKCPIGWHIPLPTTGACIVCPSGKSQGNSGSASCLDCQAGFMAADDGSATCTECENGQYQELAIQTECVHCPAGYTAPEASRTCSERPDSVDVLSPVLLSVRVIYDPKKVLDGVPLQIDTPANVSRFRLIIEEPKAAPSSLVDNLNQMITISRTEVQWSTRNDYSDKQTIGQLENEEPSIIQCRWTDEKVLTVAGQGKRIRWCYYEIDMELPYSLYTAGQKIRIRLASYLSDTSWTAWRDASVLPCAGLLGSGRDPGLPCPARNDLTSAIEPETKITSIKYNYKSKDGDPFDVYTRSIFAKGIPTITSFLVSFAIPTFEPLKFNDESLDALMKDKRSALRKPAKCMFTQIEWSPDQDFSRLRIGARKDCQDGTKSEVTIDNFDQFAEFAGSIFSYSDDKATKSGDTDQSGGGSVFYFRVRTYLDDTSTTSHIEPARRFPAPAIRGSGRNGPLIIDNFIVDERTLTLFLEIPGGPEEMDAVIEADLMFLELQFSKEREFRQTASVSYNVTTAHENGDTIKTVESDRVRVLRHGESPFVNVNVTFDAIETIFVQNYFIRIKAIYSNGATIIQDKTYSLWNAHARGCEPTVSEYLQTHLFNDPERPFTKVQDLRCQTCPVGASCSGDFVTFADIVARGGYRRLSWNASVFGACPVKEACLGVPDILDSSTGEVLSVKPLDPGDKEQFEMCREGHLQTSELCSDCDKNWLVKLTASPAGTCSACPKQENNLLLFIAMIIVALAYMTFLVEDTLSGARQMIETKEPMPFHTIAIRIMSSYLQVAGMLLSFEITIPPAVQDLVTIQRSASAVVEQTLSFDCTAGSSRGLDLFFLKQTMAAVIPLFLPCVALPWLLANSCKKFCKKKPIKYMMDKIICSIVVLYYLMFPAIVSRIAITFACTKYGDEMSQNRRYLMQRSLSTTCWSDAHSAHIATVTLPAIILYLIVCPLFLTLTLIRLRQAKVLYADDVNYKPHWTIRYGFVFAGYEPKYAWWEMVVLIRKAAFVLVTVFTRPAGMAAQVMSAVLVLILSLSAHIHVSPYDHDTHDDLESAALHASLITLPVALLANEMSRVYGTGRVGEGGTQLLGPIESLIFTITAFATFMSFVYYFVHGVFLEAQHNKKGCLKKISLRLCKKSQDGIGKSKAVRRRKLSQSLSLSPSLMNTHLEELHRMGLHTTAGKMGLSRTKGKKNAGHSFQTIGRHAVIHNRSLENLKRFHATRNGLVKKISAKQQKARGKLLRRLSSRNGKIKPNKVTKSVTKIAPRQDSPPPSRPPSNQATLTRMKPSAVKNWQTPVENSPGTKQAKAKKNKKLTRSKSSAAIQAHKQVNKQVAKKLFHKLSKNTQGVDQSNECYIEFKTLPRVLTLLKFASNDIRIFTKKVQDDFDYKKSTKLDEETFVAVLLHGLSVFKEPPSVTGRGTV